MLNRTLVISCVFILGFSSSLKASEGLFGFIYTTDTTPQGNWEYEQKQTLRSGKARGEYTAIDLRNEFEYGITDSFQGALYINSSYQHTRNLYSADNVAENLPDRDQYAVDGASVELLYRFLSPYKDSVGLAFYMEPEIAVRDRMTGLDNIERALETRLILQKNFLDDTLIFASNFMVEPEWEKEDVDGTKKELWAEFTLGGTYRFTNNWFVGLEFRNHMEFVDMNLKTQEHSAYFAGPSLHYGGEKWWWTLTILPQIAGWPRSLGAGSDGQMIDGGALHLGQHERFEVRFALGIPLQGEHSHEH